MKDKNIIKIIFVHHNQCQTNFFKPRVIKYNCPVLRFRSRKSSLNIAITVPEPEFIPVNYIIIISFHKITEQIAASVARGKRGQICTISFYVVNISIASMHFVVPKLPDETIKGEAGDATRKVASCAKRTFFREVCDSTSGNTKD